MSQQIPVVSFAAVEPSPRPVPLPIRAVSGADDVEVVDEDELRELLADSEQEKPDVDLPKGRVTQDDLDRLFGNGM